MRLFRVDDNQTFVEYEEQDFKNTHVEENLEAWLENNTEAIVEDGRLLVIGRQVSTSLGSVIDLLALDREGNTAVIELKRDKTPRETLAQALEYASFVETLDSGQLEQLLLDYTDDEGITLAEYHRDFFELTDDEAVSFNKEQRVVIVAQDITAPIRQTSMFLRQSGIRVTCLEFKYFETASKEQLLSVDIIVGKESADRAPVVTGTAKKTTKSEFLAGCLPHQKPLYEALLSLGFPTHWGTKGFSLNANVEGRDVAMCYGYPAKTYKGHPYTAFDRVVAHIQGGESLADDFREKCRSLGFVPVGKNQEWKYPLDRGLSEEELDAITDLFNSLATSMIENGLIHSSDN